MKFIGEIVDMITVGKIHTEVIGHLETPDGGLGELVIVNRSRGRGRPRNTKKRKINYECEVCGRGFQHRSRYVLHK